MDFELPGEHLAGISGSSQPRPPPGQGLRQVQATHRLSRPSQSAFDVHEAADIASNNGVGTGGLDLGYLAGQHLGREFGLLEREHPAEAAAILAKTIDSDAF